MNMLSYTSMQVYPMSMLSYMQLYAMSMFSYAISYYKYII